MSTLHEGVLKVGWKSSDSKEIKFEANRRLILKDWVSGYTFYP